MKKLLIGALALAVSSALLCSCADTPGTAASQTSAASASASTTATAATVQSTAITQTAKKTTATTKRTTATTKKTTATTATTSTTASTAPGEHVHFFDKGVCSCGENEPASIGLEYELNTLDGRESYCVVSVGTCTDTEIIISALLRDRAGVGLLLHLYGLVFPVAVACDRQ